MENGGTCSVTKARRRTNGWESVRDGRMVALPPGAALPWVLLSSNLRCPSGPQSTASYVICGGAWRTCGFRACTDYCEGNRRCKGAEFWYGDRKGSGRCRMVFTPLSPRSGGSDPGVACYRLTRTRGRGSGAFRVQTAREPAEHANYSLARPSMAPVPLEARLFVREFPLPAQWINQYKGFCLNRKGRRGRPKRIRTGKFSGCVRRCERHLGCVAITYHFNTKNTSGRCLLYFEMMVKGSGTPGITCMVYL